VFVLFSTNLTQNLHVTKVIYYEFYKRRCVINVLFIYLSTYLLLSKNMIVIDDKYIAWWLHSYLTDYALF